MDVGKYGTIDFNLSHSYNDQKVDSFKAGTIDNERLFDLEHQLPHNRTVFSTNFRNESGLELMLRANRYSSWKDATFGEVARFGSEEIGRASCRERVCQYV